MSRLITLLLSLLIAQSAFGQAPDTLWTRTYGINAYDRCFSSTKITENQYAFAGYTQVSGGNLDGQVIATNALGDSLWSRKFGAAGIEYFQSVLKTTSNQLLAIGATQSYGSGADDAWAILMSQTGDSIWQLVAGGTQQEYLSGGIELSDGSFFIYGYSASMGAGNPEGWILKISNDGDSLTSRRFAGTPGSVFSSSCALSDGSILVAGSKSSTISGDDFWLVKIDESLDTAWTRTYGGVQSESCYSVLPTSTGGALLFGHTSSFGNGQRDMWVLSVNSTGDSVGSRSYGMSGHEHGFTAIRTQEGGILLGGVTNSLSGSDSDVLLIKIGSQLDSIWALTFTRPGYDECWTIQQTATGGFIAAGIASQGGHGLDDWLLFGVDRDPQFPTSRVVAPNGAEEINIFSSDTIRWTGVGFDGGVSIALNRHYPIGAWEVITDSTENDGGYAWFVTDPLSDSCRIRICAVQDTFCDISDGNFSIVSSQGYLALVKSSAPSSPVLNWNFGAVECPVFQTESFRLKNFGSEAVVVFQPLEPPSAEFSRTTECGSFFALAPNQMSACSLQLSFAPSADGSYVDTLSIQTDAVNGVGGYVKIPLAGTQISTPAAAQVVITSQGSSARLMWNPVTESLGECPVTVTHYLVFYSPTEQGPYYYHGLTSDTTYVHTGVIAYAPAMFYTVTPMTGAIPSLLRDIEPGEMTREDVMEKIEN